MFGIKIIEFDHSDGTVESFNRIFPNTPLKGSGNVEILEITRFNKGNLYVRDIKFNGQIFAFDFGQNNFVNSNYFAEDKTRFKYTAKDFGGNILATAYNIKELAAKMRCGESVIKNKLKKPTIYVDRAKYCFNITRSEM